MEIFGILAFTFALPALGIAVLVYFRIDDIEKRLKVAEKNGFQ